MLLTYRQSRTPERMCGVRGRRDSCSLSLSEPDSGENARCEGERGEVLTYRQSRTPERMRGVRGERGEGVGVQRSL